MADVGSSYVPSITFFLTNDITNNETHIRDPSAGLTLFLFDLCKVFTMFLTNILQGPGNQAVCRGDFQKLGDVGLQH